MPEQEPKLFWVRGHEYMYATTLLNDGLHWIDYGEVSSFSGFVAAASSDDAIKRLWQKMEEAHILYMDKIKPLRDEVLTLKKQERYAESMSRWTEVITEFKEANPLPPPVPTVRERWRADEVEVKGYRIKLEPITQ